MLRRRRRDRTRAGDATYHGRSISRTYWCCDNNSMSHDASHRHDARRLVTRRGEEGGRRRKKEGARAASGRARRVDA